MSKNTIRRYLPDSSFVEIAIHEIPTDKDRPHGFHYRLAWIQVSEHCLHRRRVLFDNHNGKPDHFHLDEMEYPYEFKNIDQLLEDFAQAIRKLGGLI